MIEPALQFGEALVLRIDPRLLRLQLRLCGIELLLDGGAGGATLGVDGQGDQPRSCKQRGDES
ncbi:hypothetical protein ASG67_09985 [Sphingomonas sp. Leaf339]|nr:hypothetical protein ASG67_09985 [Sphingomonas sp. Leaf339]